ncbi:hypothetical protein [Ciceribacter sichuanensis]
MKPVTLMAASLVSVMACSAIPTLAQDADANRFSLEKTDSGFIRLDRRNGALTLCQEKDGTLTCRMAADERAAYEEELDRLEKRVAALEKKQGEGQPLARSGENLPSDEEVERSIGIMERFMRSFFGLVEEFKQREENSPPNKT